MPVKITYAMIDVQGSRRRLEKRVKGGERVPFTVTGYLNHAMNDDGTSQEYAAEVTDFAVDGEGQS